MPIILHLRQECTPRLLNCAVQGRVSKGLCSDNARFMTYLTSHNRYIQNLCMPLHISALVSFNAAHHPLSTAALASSTSFMIQGSAIGVDLSPSHPDIMLRNPTAISVF